MTIPAIPISSSFWAGFANHLWQSTLVAGVAGLLTLALKRNGAQTRYRLWLAASVKFLIPFSLLVSAGSYWGWAKAPATTQPGFIIVIEDVSQPFSAAPVSSIAPAYSQAFAKALHLLPGFILTGWFCGCALVFFGWLRRWRRLNAVLRRSVKAESGRELETLRQLTANASTARRVDLIISVSAMEPGIVGIFRPVLMLPEGISRRLTDAEFAALITHELCHVRRHDNLASALHMLVEALFWFHPLVWWIGARLVDERERACDEEVLRLGSEPQVYAEGILKVCEFYLEAPLVCVAGVTGSNLKQRIEEIMIHRIASKLDSGRKILLATVGAATLAGPIVFGLFHATPSRAQTQSAPLGFESVMIRPNKTGEAMPPFHIVSDPPGKGVGFKNGPEGFLATNAPLRALIRFAYGVRDNQISGGPEWMDSERYDVVTRFTRPTTGESPSDYQQVKLLVQALLADRFKLVVHHEVKQLPAYLLVVGPNGSKLTEVQMVAPDGLIHSRILDSNHQLVGHQIQLSTLVGTLTQRLGRTVIDETNLKGAYDFTLDWPLPQSPDSQAALVAALRDQLGLELREQPTMVDTIVVDHAQPLTDQQ